MENATDALIMAGQILVFILALTVCMSSFNTLRADITDLIEQHETIKMTTKKNSEGYLNYIESKKSNSIRVVGAETVISSMYRAVKENYVVYIKLDQDTITIPAKSKRWLNKAETVGYGEYDDGEVVMIKAKENLVIGNETFIKADEDWLIKVTIGRVQEGINEKVNKILKEQNFYDLIISKKFNEYLGEYQDGTDASTENKLIKRIITYIETKNK